MLERDPLRLLYLDWCSAQLAQRVLEMSHDDLWLYFRRVALVLADEMNLPSYAEWRADHLRGAEGGLEREE